MNKRKYIAIALTIVMSLYLLSPNISNALPVDLDGQGTEQSPYLIRNVEDLNRIPSTSTAHYQLMNDLDLQNIKHTPIDSFSGVFDGGNFTIKNLLVQEDDLSGLFSFTSNATIKNLTIDGANISNGWYSGVIAGYIEGTTIENCLVNSIEVSGIGAVGSLCGLSELNSNIINTVATGGAISADNGSAGGLIGNASDTKLYQCSSGIEVVTSSTGIGGLIGVTTAGNDKVHITQCYANNKVTGAKSVGGFVGITDEQTDSLIIEDSYSISSVEAMDNEAGGLISNTANNSATIRNSYFAGTIQAASKVGLGLGDITNSYFNRDTVGLSDPESEARTTAQLQDKANYISWDFNEVWKMKDGQAYPRLQFQKDTEEDFSEVEIQIIIELGESRQLSVDLDLSENADMLWTVTGSAITGGGIVTGSAITGDGAVTGSAITVDDMGIVTGHNLGYGTVVAKDQYSSFTAKINVLVVESLFDYHLALDMKVGEKRKVTINDQIKLDQITWVVTGSAIGVASGSSIISVSTTGNVKSHSPGLGVVAALDPVGNVVDKVYIRVRED